MGCLIIFLLAFWLLSLTFSTCLQPGGPEMYSHFQMKAEKLLRVTGVGVIRDVIWDEAVRVGNMTGPELSAYSAMGIFQVSGI